MSAQDCKLPIGDGYKYLAENEKEATKKNSSKFLLIIAALLLIVSMTILLGFTFHLSSELKELEKDFVQLKRSIEKLESAIEEQYDDLDTLKEPKTSKSDENYEEFYEYISDDLAPNYETDDYYADEEDNEENDYETTSSTETKPLYGGQFTKDAKLSRTTRNKRNVVGYTEDGVPIHSESFAEARRRNATYRRHNYHHRLPTLPPNYLSSYNYQDRSNEESTKKATTVRPVYSRRSRVMLQEDPTKAFRQVVKKSSLLKSLDQHRNSEEDSDIEFTIVRSERDRPHRHRQQHLEVLDERHPRIGRMRPLPTAHFSGDTSKYTYGQHDNYNGNGHLRHPHSTYVDWIESNWYHTLGMDRHFSYSDGVLTIKDSGLYFIYAQIYYLDEHDMNGYRVYKNNETILQCTTMTHSVDRIMKGNTCYTAAAEYLQEGDKISLGDLSSSRYSLFEPGKSFFGVIKLGDVKIK